MKREFKIGDRVKIAVSSNYYDDNAASNPKNILGVINSISDSSHGTLVKWDNGYTNGYSTHDLELVEETATTQTVSRKALSEIYFEVCFDWQKKIKRILDNNLLADEFKVSSSLIEEAYKDANDRILLDWLVKYLPKPKKMVTKEVVLYYNLRSDGKWGVYEDKETAIDRAGFSRLPKAIKLTGTYQIEE